MAKKSEDKELDFFYINDDRKTVHNKQKKKTKRRGTNNKNNKNINNKKGLADNEIIIGVNTKPIGENNNKNEKNKKSKVSNKNKKQNNKVKRNTNTRKDKPNSTNNARKKSKNRIISLGVKLIIVFILLGASIAYLVTSPIFNISKIEVLGNTKITSDTYISLSNITIGYNIFDLSKKQTIQNIKQNPYVDTVKVKRKLPDTIEIIVTEREASYMLDILNSYAYINNQGYILEINEEKINAPVITGYSIPQEEIVPGGRLNSEDLLRLEMVLKIMDAISVSGITETVNEINISDKSNYTLKFYEEDKTAYLGDCSNLTDRISIYLKAILQKEKGKSGEIFINGDLNQDKVFFREKV